MKDKFTVSVSDVRGVKTYSFNQVVLKFFWIILFTVTFILIVGGLEIWWLKYQINNVEAKRLFEETRYLEIVKKGNILEKNLLDKGNQVELLNETLVNLEELINGEHKTLKISKDNRKEVKLNTVEKTLMLYSIPNGRPITNYRGISSEYGFRTHPIHNTKEFHNGLDYRGKLGDTVIVTADGVVEYSGYNKKSGYGHMVLVTHSNGFKTLYGHMSKRVVKSGEVVFKGQKIGEIGSTGLSSGPHLHYEVSWIQRKVNPSYFVKWRLDNFYSIKTKTRNIPWNSLNQMIKNRLKKVEKQLLLQDALLKVNLLNWKETY